MLDVLFWCWAAWCCLNLILLLASPWLVPVEKGAFTNGLVIIMPTEWVATLTHEELKAVMAHERGHITNMHALKNLLRTFLLMPRSVELGWRQELEADDYAAKHADPQALADVLRRTSTHRFDLYRATRLAMIAAQHAA
jgi:Zn-dependent protease with chaperone function